MDFITGTATRSSSLSYMLRETVAGKGDLKSDFLRSFGLFLLGILLSLPVLVNGFPVLGHDTNIHLARYMRFADQFWLGELYPRWLMDLNAGFGDAVFFSTAPFPNDPFGWYQMGLSASFALIASGIFAYIWLKSITNQNAVFVGASVYMLFPYHFEPEKSLASGLLLLQQP